MPIKPFRPCNQMGCPELIRDGRYCERHKKEKQKQIDTSRGSSKDRGYDGRWQQVRALCLKRNPLCQRCHEAGLIRPAALVHHVKSISKGGAVYAFDNLRALCTACHDVIHREQGDKW